MPLLAVLLPRFTPDAGTALFNLVLGGAFLVFRDAIADGLTARRRPSERRRRRVRLECTVVGWVGVAVGVAGLVLWLAGIPWPDAQRDTQSFDS